MTLAGSPEFFKNQVITKENYPSLISIIIITINNNNNNNPNLLLITKLTIKSYLQLISLKKTIQSKHYLHYSFRLKKKDTYFRLKKIIPIKIYHIFGKIRLQNGSFQLN